MRVGMRAHRGESRQHVAPGAVQASCRGRQRCRRPRAGARSRRKQWVEPERLKGSGRERAMTWGWPNTYSYSKSLRPAISADTHDGVHRHRGAPAVGNRERPQGSSPRWNPGRELPVRRSLTFPGRGYRFYTGAATPGAGIIPVDLAAHAIIPVIGALLLKRHQPIYQLCTSDADPLPEMRRLVELCTALSNRREHRQTGGGPHGQVGATLEAVVVSQDTYELVARPCLQFCAMLPGWQRPWRASSQRRHGNSSNGLHAFPRTLGWRAH